MLKALLAFLFSVNAYAVQTSKCPEELKIEVPEIQVFSKAFIDNNIEEHYTDWVDQDSIDYFLDNNLTSMEFTGSLKEKVNSNCIYEVDSGDEEIEILVKIIGTHADPKLKVLYIHSKEKASFHMFADATSKEPVYDFSRSELQIKAQAQTSDWGETWGFFVPVGKGKISGDGAQSVNYTCESQEGFGPDIQLDVHGVDEIWVNGKDLAQVDETYVPIRPEYGYQKLKGRFDSIDDGLEGYGVELYIDDNVLLGNDGGFLKYVIDGPDGAFPLFYICWKN